ncbi:MAG: hypothetical protein KGO03_04770 [Gemmatimonadota bacterium]|nr:hypothetical protein [Gemmatimonadota bacterium]MDE3215688.1 hypothetical protein [Gemmatimonadota bacterium]
MLLAAAPRVGAQTATRPYLDWRTIRTAHFRVHYPADYEGWARGVAAHIEGVDSAVSRLVGFTPARPVDVVISNPYDEPNGSALPFLDAPVLNFWPVPPDPRQDIGNWRTWGEMLSVHEFAHLAHLTRPSRNPADRLFWRLMPVDLGPLPQKLPRWAIEGYATYVEGQVTGSGRPNGAWRAAVLRQWALEGHLPTYQQMSNWDAFDGGDFAYLAGSAFLEWLATSYGDSTLVFVWRRATARVERSFDNAFAGVYGDPPPVLYGRFTAQLTAQAMDAQRAIADAGRTQGAVVQHLDWGTGDPAFSRDGTRVAIVLRSGNRPGRTVIWAASPAADTAAERRARAILARDPEDVPAIAVYPPPRQALATLTAVDGQPFVQPRFVDDSAHVLVSRLTTQADGTMRPDLYLWNTASGGVRRVTRDAGVENADPSPDGRDALATRCAAGSCDVVRVDLATGRVTPVLAGNSGRSYFRPRYAPDGRRFVVSASDSGRWVLQVADRDGGQPATVLAGDRANRFDATFSASGDTLLYATDRGGVINLAGCDLRNRHPRREFMLTSVTGAAVAPAEDPATGAIWFLSLHARGYDLRAVPPARAAAPVSITGRFGAASPPNVVPRPPMPVNPVSAPRAYGLGPRHTRYLPGETYGPDGASTAVYLTNTDVIGRLSTLVAGSYGARAQWNGGTAQLAWRGSRVEFEAGAHWARRLASAGVEAGSVGRTLDDTRTGGLLAASYERSGSESDWRLRVGVGGERIATPDTAGSLARTVAFGEWSGALGQTSGRRAVVERLALHADAERTGTDRVARGLARATLAATGVTVLPFAASVTYGLMSGSSRASDRFSAGGLNSPIVDSSLSAARVAVPWLPNGAAVPDGPGTRSSVVALRGWIPLGVLAPFYEAVSVSSSDAFRAWHRGLGAELRVRFGGLSQLFLPAVDVRLGLARSLDAPVGRRTAFYAVLRYLP